MPFNFRLNVQNVFRRLGIQFGAKLPQLEDNVQMIMIMTDLSRLIPAPIEPRGFAGANFVGAGFDFPVIQLQALSAGGVFVEQMFIRGSSPGVTENYHVQVDETDLGLPLGTQISIGGTPIQSRFTAGDITVPTDGVIMPAPNGFSAFALSLGIFVPNQFFFSVRQTNATRRHDVAIIYRELPSVEEVG